MVVTMGHSVGFRHRTNTRSYSLCDCLVTRMCVRCPEWWSREYQELCVEYRIVEAPREHADMMTAIIALLLKTWHHVSVNELSM